MIELIVLGIATAVNFLVIKWKVENKRYGDAVLDSLILFMITSLFGGSLGGMTIAMVASLITSTYLLIYPPKTPTFDKEKRRITWK